MNLLESLLPGVRAIRAPFAAGAIAMLAIWLAVEPKRPCDDWAKGLCDSFVALDGTVSTLAIASIVAFAAYLIGALMTTITDAVVRLPLAAGWFRPLQSWLEEAVPKDEEHDQALDARGGELRARYEDLLVPLPQPTPVRICKWVGQRVSRRAPAEGKIDVKTWWSATRTAQREWRQTHFRLLDQRPELHGELDRLEAEGEFRFAIALPLLGLGLVIADRQDSWLIVIGTIAVVVVLVVGGVGNTKRAELALSDLIIHGHVELPFMTALKRELEISDERPRGEPPASGGLPDSQRSGDRIARGLRAAERRLTALCRHRTADRGDKPGP